MVASWQKGVCGIFRRVLRRMARRLLPSFAGEPRGTSPQLALKREEYERAVEAGVPSFAAGNAPPYTGHPFEVIDGNLPSFDAAERKLPPGYEHYSELDVLGRCGPALALIGRETMPVEGATRKDINHVRPSGWPDARCSEAEDGLLYHRCHLIGYRLTAEDDNPRNLFTGTRYLNHAMRVFENMAAAYCGAADGNRVLYRATPCFSGTDLVARGVQLEALSVGGSESEGVAFNVLLHNVQPGIRIDYATGAGRKDPSVRDSMLRSCVVNEGTRIFHRPDCPAIRRVAEGHRGTFTGLRGELIAAGYAPCKRCDP